MSKLRVGCCFGLKRFSEVSVLIFSLKFRCDFTPPVVLKKAPVRSAQNIITSDLLERPDIVSRVKMRLVSFGLFPKYKFSKLLLSFVSVFVTIRSIESIVPRFAPSFEIVNGIARTSLKSLRYI